MLKGINVRMSSKSFIYFTVAPHLSYVEKVENKPAGANNTVLLFWNPF